MPTMLKQIVAYTTDPIYERLKRDAMQSERRPSVSAVIHRILKSHYFPSKPKH